MMRNGVAPVNAVLVGTVFSALFPVVFCMERTTALWVFIVLGSFSRYYFGIKFLLYVNNWKHLWLILSLEYSNDPYSIYSQFICSAFNNILSKFKIPYMAWPFNVIATASFMALHAFYEGDKTKGKSYFFYIEMSYLLPLPL